MLFVMDNVKKQRVIYYICGMRKVHNRIPKITEGRAR